MMFKEMRRQDRELKPPKAIKLLKHGQYGVLSTVSENGYAYGVPLNYVYLDNSIYFHCAIEGHKLENIAGNDKVSFCVIGQTRVLPDQFSSEYESVIVFGKALEVFDEEKNWALVGLLNKYAKEYLQKGKEYIEKSAMNTKVIKIKVECITGKAQG